MSISRRKFIKVTSIVSATALPVIGFLTYELNERNKEAAFEKSFNDALEFHVIDNNLLNLHFYFINVNRKGFSLIPASDDKNVNSFMVVRLPQMHINEKGYWQDDWNSANYPEKKYPNANLSGYSYLAFQLWPIKKDKNGNILPVIKKIEFTLENILNWTNEQNFDLITLVEWFNLKNAKIEDLDFVNYAKDDCQTFNDKKLFKPDDTVAVFTSSEPKSSIYKKYKSIVNKFLDGNLKQADLNDKFIPATFFEVPQELCLIPVSRHANGDLVKKTKKFWPNYIINQKGNKASYRKYEVWNNTLFFKSEGGLDNNNASKEFKIETPSFRAIGLISEIAINCPADALECAADCAQQKEQYFLPSLLDKAELAYLTQYAKDEKNKADNFKERDFDIKELNGFFFTGLGIITHLKYYNLDKCPPGIDLIEYEHIINQGRDVFIRVSRLGYNSKTGQRYKHIIEGRRKIENVIENEDDKPIYTFPNGATSFVELKQYCECIDKHIVYTDENNVDKWHDKFYKITIYPLDPILTPINTNNPDFKRNIFKELTTIERKRIPIRCLSKSTKSGNPVEVLPQDICTIQCLDWFWPTIEIATKTGDLEKDIPTIKYLPCEFEGTDWENKTISAKTPFMFLRKSYLENGMKDMEAYRNYLSGDFKTDFNLIERRKTYFNSQKIAFTKSLDRDKADKIVELKIKNNPIYINDIKNLEAALNDENTSRSKVNILETEFIEHYFNIKKPEAFELWEDGSKSIVRTKYVIFPQILRAKVFVDHIKDLTGQKIPSVIEYHRDYIEHELNDVVDSTTKQYANGAKLILANTDAFINQKEEIVNNRYGEIKNALQEAKDKLGNLAVPDIVPDTISLEKFGVTLPKNLSDSIAKGKTVLSDATAGLQKIASFNPRELLRGKLSDVCGLDLTAILDELIPADSANNQTPLFEINKILNKVEGEILNSPVYNDIVNGILIDDPIANDDGTHDKLSPTDLIKKYDGKIEQVRNKIEDARIELNANIKAISDQIPNIEELDNLVKNLFERYRTKALEILGDYAPFQNVREYLTQLNSEGKTIIQKAKDFFNVEIKLLKDDYQGKLNDLNGVLNEIDEIITKEINDELKKPELIDLLNKVNELFAIAHNFGQLDAVYNLSVTKLYNDFTGTTTNYNDFLNNRFDSLLLNDQESSFPNILGNKVYINVSNYEFEMVDNQSATQIPFNKIDNIDNAGLIQIERKSADFSLLIIKNINGNAFQKAVVEELQKNYFNQYNQKLKLIEATLENFYSRLLGDLSEKIRKWSNEFDATIGGAINKNLSLQAQEALIKIKTYLVRLLPYIDALRKLDPYFYYTEQQRLKKDILDVKKRFFKSLINYFGNEESFSNLDCGVCYTINNERKLEYGEFKSVLCEIKCCLDKYQELINSLYNTDPAKSITPQQFINDYKNYITNRISSIPNRVFNLIINSEEYKSAKAIYEQISTIRKNIETNENLLKNYLLNYKLILQQHATDYAKQLDQKVTDYIDKKEDDLIKAVGADNILALQQDISNAKNIYRLLMSIKQQDLAYNWNTTSFRDINLGIVSFKKFSNPDTTLKVDVKATTYFTSGKFPPAIERVVFYSENRFTNFGIGFFNILTIGFNEITFTAGSDHSSHFDVKIKDVKFDGALSFVQKFESFLKTMGKGLILKLEADHLALGYCLPIPSIQTPAFSFFNLSLNFDLRVYFDKRPLRFGFSLATAESKFGIAATIYAGFGFFGIVADPKHGIVEIECALEAGVWAGIQIGPISGEVKLAFGFYYRKNEFGVRLEGYIVAEGHLSVWILEIYARVYLGVISENSVVEGECTVTVNVKLGFISKSFSGSFHRRIAGAQGNNNEQVKDNIKNDLTKNLFTWYEGNNLLFSKDNKEMMNHLNESLNDLSNEFEDETYAVSENEWREFIESY